MEGTDNLEDAKTLMDWTLGDGMKLFGERQSIIADSSFKISLFHQHFCQ